MKRSWGGPKEQGAARRVSRLATACLLALLAPVPVAARDIGAMLGHGLRIATAWDAPLDTLPVPDAFAGDPSIFPLILPSADERRFGSVRYGDPDAAEGVICQRQNGDDWRAYRYMLETAAQEGREHDAYSFDLLRHIPHDVGEVMICVLTFALPPEDARKLGSQAEAWLDAHFATVSREDPPLLKAYRWLAQGAFEGDDLPPILFEIRPREGDEAVIDLTITTWRAVR